MILVRGPRQHWRAGRLSTYGFSADSIVAAGAAPDASPSAPARGLRHDRRGPSKGGPSLPMLSSSGTGTRRLRWTVNSTWEPGLRRIRPVGHPPLNDKPGLRPGWRVSSGGLRAATYWRGTQPISRPESARPTLRRSITTEEASPSPATRPRQRAPKSSATVATDHTSPSERAHAARRHRRRDGARPS
jgi:hypothetical protein